MKSTQKVTYLLAIAIFCFASIGFSQELSKKTDRASELMSTGKYEEARKIFLDVS